jgi:hypothetical protein
MTLSRRTRGFETGGVVSRTHSRCPRHGKLSDQTAQFAEGRQPDTGAWFDDESCTEDGIEHPGRHCERGPIVKLNDELFPTSTSRAPQDSA